MKYTELDKSVFRTIGDFYYDMSNEEQMRLHPNVKNPDLELTPELLKEIEDVVFNTYNTAQKNILQLGITRIEVNPETMEVSIYLSRPGIIIGEKGKNIELLRNYLRKQLADNCVNIKIIEDRLYDFLIPVDYSDY